jgi:hypothetical protein
VVASVTAESNLRESLECGKIYAKHDKQLMRSRGRAPEWKYGTTLFDSYSGKIIRALTSEINVINQEVVVGLLTKNSKF